MNGALIREALEQERKTYTWWLYCRHASVEERRVAYKKVQEIDAALSGSGGDE